MLQMRDITGSKDVIASFLAWWKATRCGVVFVRGAANLQFAKDPFKRVALHAGAAEAGIQLSEHADLVAEVPTPALHCCQLRGSFLRQGRQPRRLPLVRVALGRGGRRCCLQLLQSSACAAKPTTDFDSLTYCSWLFDSSLTY